MRWPLDKFWISQGFHGINKDYNYEHWGVDLATHGATQGDHIKAPESGRIDAVNNDATGYFGGMYVVLIGDSGHRHYMGHNRTNHVSPGQRVAEGQHIADVGMTGQADGPHIHYQVSKNGVDIDPTPLMKEEEQDMAEKVNLNTARMFAYAFWGTDGRAGRQNARNGDRDKDLKQFHVGQELTNELVRKAFDAGESAAYRKELDGVYAERDRLRKEVAQLKKQVSTVSPAIATTVLKPGIYEVK